MSQIRDGEPGLWVPLSASDAANWRRAAVERVAGGRKRVHQSRRGGIVQGRGGILERDIIRVNETTAAPHEGDVASVDVPARERGVREARETVGILASDILAWVRSDPDLYEERVKHIVARAKAAGALGHLSDDDAARQVHDLAVKLARADAEKVYAKQRLNRTVLIDGVF